MGSDSDIPPTVRRECLEHLRDLLCHHPRRVQLFISANDPEGRNSLRYRLFGMDSLVVVGRSFVFWRHFNLAMNFDTEPEKIDSYGGLLDEFRKSAKHQGQLQTIQFLNGLINSLSGRTR